LNQIKQLLQFELEQIVITIRIRSNIYWHWIIILEYFLVKFLFWSSKLIYRFNKILRFELDQTFTTIEVDHIFSAT